jgi:hypothetical protein
LTAPGRGRIHTAMNVRMLIIGKLITDSLGTGMRGVF